MELWIRSQDRRTLLKANRIDVDDIDIICWDNDYRCSETYMGKYKTKERALEVLDEIQKLITPQIIMREMKSTGLIENGMSDGTLYIKNEPIVQIIDPIVYEMPEE